MNVQYITNFSFQPNNEALLRTSIFKSFDQIELILLRMSSKPPLQLLSLWLEEFSNP